MIDLIFRDPTVNDALDIWELVRNSKPLDENSKYLYALLCHQFAKTCTVVEFDSKIVGFISAFVSPLKPDTLFVWQVAVDINYRKKGIAEKLVTYSMSKVMPGIRYVEATVTPSNISSLKFLQNFANTMTTEFSKKPLFSSSVLGIEHEQEDLIRIGPITTAIKEAII